MIKMTTNDGMSELLRLKTHGFLGVGYFDVEKNGQLMPDYQIDLKSPLYLNMGEKDHTFICASSGSGKSHLLGVLVEESIRLMKNTAVLIVDKMGIFSTLGKPGLQAPIDEWNEKTKPYFQIAPSGLGNVEIWIPKGEKNKYDEDFYDRTFSIKPAELDPYIFCYTYGIKMKDQQANLLKKCMSELREKLPDFTINDLTKYIHENGTSMGFKSQSVDALFSKIIALYDTGILSSTDGISLPELLRPGHAAVLDLSTLDKESATLVVNIITNKIINDPNSSSIGISQAEQFQNLYSAIYPSYPFDIR